MLPIRVALVNDYEIVVQGLAGMLQGHEDVLEVVELDAGESVDVTVDVALYDTFARRADAAGGVTDLAANPAVARTVVYSWNTDPKVISETLAKGADAYLSKELTAEELVDALVAVHRGEPLPDAPRHRGRTVTDGDWPGRDRGLTQRESEVLALITMGLSNNAIAQALYLSVNSVKTHIRTCYRRLGLTNRSAAIIWGIDNGFRPTRAHVADDEAK